MLSFFTGDLSPLEKIIKNYDVNRDGTFSISEVKAIVQDMDAAKKNARNMGRLAGVVVLIVMLLCGALLGLMFAANEASKEEHTQPGGRKVDLDGSIVKVANDQMQVVPDGQMKTRTLTDPKLEEGPEQAQTMSVAQALSERTLSSSLPDEAFTELKTLRLDGPDGDEVFVSVNVLATARYKNKASRCGTIVVIYTHLGEVTLDGEDIYFEERIQDSFTAAGFKTTILDHSNF